MWGETLAGRESGEYILGSKRLEISFDDGDTCWETRVGTTDEVSMPALDIPDRICRVE
jgi:hypothetical protein